MNIAEFDIVGNTSLGFSKIADSPQKDKEPHDKYDERVWRERCHHDNDGNVFIPPMALKQCIDSVAAFLSRKLKGQKTYTKRFQSGIFVSEPIMLGITQKDLQMEKLFLNSDGRAGGGSRVWKRYPVLLTWSGHCTVHVLDDMITKEIFFDHISNAGTFIGLGRHRPEKRGYFGRFEVKNFEWAAVEKEVMA